MKDQLQKAREALKRLLDRDMRNTCQHENTHRGGVIWEICDDCGMKWADDRGGKPEWKDPPEWAAAEAAITALTQLEAMAGEPVAWNSAKQADLNDWFLSLPEGRRAALIADKWTLAGAAFEAGKQFAAPPAQQPLPEASPATKGQCNDERACGACWSGQGACEVSQQPQTEAVPVAVLRRGEGGAFSVTVGENLLAVYALPPGNHDLFTRPQQAEAVPPGYVPVPVEPTVAMLQALSGEWHPSRHRPDLYRAMIDAAIAQQKGGV